MKLLLLCLCVAAASAGIAPLYTSEQRSVPDSWIIKVKDFDQVEQVAEEIASRFQVKRMPTPKINKLKKLLPVLTVRIPARLLDEIRTIDGIEYIEEDGIATPAGYQPNPPSWGIDRVDSRSGTDGYYDYNDDAQGSGINLYVADTGIRVDHTAFGGRASILFGSTDDHGHGTHCAGTAAGNIYGLAREANIYSVQVCVKGSCPTSNMLEGLEKVRQHAPSTGGVVSMSLSGLLFSNAMNDAVKEMWDAKILVSHAAGNSNYNACWFTPQKTANLIVVAASDSNDYRASFSNYGSCVDIFAPGVDIVSAGHASKTASATMSGTSMACPHVSGAAVIEYGKDSNATPSKVKQALIDNATKGAIKGDTKSTPNRLLYVNPN